MSTANAAWLSIIRAANRKSKNSYFLRRVGIYSYIWLVQMNRFLPPPRVFLNGPPKTGTHLLSDCLSLMPKMMFSGRHFALPDFFARSSQAGSPTSAPSEYAALNSSRLRTFLAKCPQGMFVTAHARFHPDLQVLLRDLQLRHVLLIRDPRDVVVSHAFFVKHMSLHPQHTYFMDVLTTDAERIMASIRGFGPAMADNDSFISIPDIFAKFSRWLDDPSVLIVRFEDLVGVQGGGESKTQLENITAIAHFIDRPLSQTQVKDIAQRMYGKGGLTFRKGQTGDWRNHFTAAHKQAFKEVAGDLLIRFGYETDMRW